MEVFLNINSGEQEHKGKTSTWSLTMFMEDENQAAKAKTIIANFILEIVYVCRVCKRAKGKTDTMGTAASCVRFFLPYPFWIGKIFNTQSQYNTVQILSDYPCPCSCLVLPIPLLTQWAMLRSTLCFQCRCPWSWCWFKKNLDRFRGKIALLRIGKDTLFSWCKGYGGPDCVALTQNMTTKKVSLPGLQGRALYYIVCSLRTLCEELSPDKMVNGKGL